MAAGSDTSFDDMLLQLLKDLREDDRDELCYRYGAHFDTDGKPSPVQAIKALKRQGHVQNSKGSLNTLKEKLVAQKRKDLAVKVEQYIACHFTNNKMPRRPSECKEETGLPVR